MDGWTDGQKDRQMNFSENTTPSVPGSMKEHVTPC